MKNLIIICLMLISISCTESNQTETPAAKAQKSTTEYNLDWLEGNWKRINDEEGKRTFEQWIKKSEDEYLGLGYTLQAKDTVFKENMRIIKLNKVWNLEVSGVHEQPVFFEFTSQSKNSFVCENEANEFPKKISYVSKGNQIEARVSAGDVEIPFYFERND